MHFQYIFILLVATSFNCIICNEDENPESSPEQHKPDEKEFDEHYSEDGKHHEEYDHEVVTGSKEESQRVGHMSEHDAKEYLNEIITKLDVNKDGLISKDEIVSWVKGSARNRLMEMGAKDVAHMDPLGDGVDFTEYIHTVWGYTEDALPNLANDTTKQDLLKTIEEDRKKFAAADLDRNKKLSLDEWLAFAHPDHYPHMVDFAIKYALQNFDTNNDTFLSRDEYTVLNKGGHHYMTLEQGLKHFDKSDTNKDGKMDAKELREFLLTENNVSADEEASHLLEETDADKNGVLTRAEILDNYHLWVGGQDEEHQHTASHMSDEL